MKQKRGISPLIATILLIGLTVVLAAIVLTWGQGWFSTLTESTTKSTSLQLACTNQGGLTIVEVCNETAVSSTRITIMNTGTIDYTSCTLAGGGKTESCDALASGGVSSYTLGADLDAGDTVSSIFTIEIDAGTATCQGSLYTVPQSGLKDC